MKLERGFTLLELLVALAVLGMVVGVTYAAIVPAGEGFRMLSEERSKLETAYVINRRLRMDISWLSPSLDRTQNPLRISFDSRGASSYDQLWFLMHEPNTPSLNRIHYYIDEDSEQLIREVSMPWAKPNGEEPLRWELGAASSFSVEALDKSGSWQKQWDASKMNGKLPRALRVRIMDTSEYERELTLPIFAEQAIK
ncbi:MAG: prepilin-type N-terminal cleavage/methylation domain-containing protein [Mariprofundaceae bacterium]